MNHPPMVSHRAHGYTVWANRRLMGLTAAPPGAGDTIVVTLQDVPGADGQPSRFDATESYVSPFVAASGEPMLRVSFDAEARCFRLRHWDGTECAVHRSGRQLSMTWPASVHDPEEFLLGTGLGFALRLSGELCLHASSVAIDGRAVLFAGPSLAGKSTVVAALGVRGHTVITDDLAVVTRTSRGFVVQPGACRVRLRQDAASMVQAHANRALFWAPSPDNAFVDLRLDQAGLVQRASATPLEAVCFLHPDPAAAERPSVEDVTPADALIALVSDTWAARFQDRTMRQREFEAASDLVGSIRVRRIRYRAGADVSPLVDSITREMDHAGVGQR